MEQKSLSSKPRTTNRKKESFSHPSLVGAGEEVAGLNFPFI